MNNKDVIDNCLHIGHSSLQWLIKFYVTDHELLVQMMKLLHFFSLRFSDKTLRQVTLAFRYMYYVG